jgi:hypothetical protein
MIVWYCIIRGTNISDGSVYLNIHKIEKYHQHGDCKKSKTNMCVQIKISNARPFGNLITILFVCQTEEVFRIIHLHSEAKTSWKAKRMVFCKTPSTFHSSEYQNGILNGFIYYFWLLFYVYSILHFSGCCT